MEDTKALVVVLGYGCHLTEKMQRYLDGVVAFVKNNSVAWVIATGGYTNKKSAPKMSEAEVMANYLRRHGIAVITENAARTTVENFEGIAKIICRRNIRPTSIVVFCNKTHATKARVIGRAILGVWPEIKPADVLGTSGKEICKQVIATPLDVLSLWIPFIRRQGLRRKEHIMRNS